jgi:hypothetical protein
MGKAVYAKGIPYGKVSYTDLPAVLFWQAGRNKLLNLVPIQKFRDGIPYRYKMTKQTDFLTFL